MGRYLNVIVITIVIVFCGCSCSKQIYRYNYEPRLDLGERFMGVDNSSSNYTIITPFNADTLIQRVVYKDGIRYEIGVDDQNIIKYIQCYQKGVTLGGYTLDYNLPKNLKGEIKLGDKSNDFYIKLKDGWWLKFAAFKDGIDCGDIVIKYAEWK